MAPKDFISPIELVVFNAAALAPAVWSILNPGGLEKACSTITINNDSDTGIFVGIGDYHEHEYIPKCTKLSLNFQSNSSPRNKVSKLKKGTQIYISGNPFKGGRICLSGYYN